MTKLIIAEKSIAGRRIASILADKEVPAEEFEKTQVFRFKRNNVDYVVLPLRGHIVDVDFPKSYSYWTGVDLRKLARADIEYVGKEKNIISGLVGIAASIDDVIIATDSDREGESIGVEALNYVKEKNSSAIFEEAVKNELQRNLSIRMKKIYPLSLCEIRVLKVEKEK